MNYREEIEKYRDEILGIRRAIHMNPEIGDDTYETAALVERTLNGWGIPTKRIIGSAVVGELKGALPGPTVGLRADMDALPVTEMTGCSFASKVPGKMHACGHDVHTSAALGAARLLSSDRENLRGTVRFFFQPNEEYSGGAKRMIEAGCMGDAQAVFGAHVDPNLPEGTIGIRYGKFYASSDVIEIAVHGKSCHGATPEKGVSALYAAADIALRLQALPKQITTDRCVLTIGELHAGTACNIVPGEAAMDGILRALGKENRAKMKEAIASVIEETAASHGATVDLTINKSYDGIVNTDEGSDLAERAAVELLGREHVARIAEPLMISEDFGCFIDASSGAFYHIGAGNTNPLHSDHFLPTEGALLTAAAVHAAVLKKYLDEHA